MNNVTTNQAGHINGDYKTHALIAYVLIGVGLFTAIPILFGAIWAMIKKKGSTGTIFHSHFVNSTRIFWWSLLWMIVGALLHVVMIGYLVWAAAWLWALYRVVDGIAKNTSNEAYPVG